MTLTLRCTLRTAFLCCAAAIIAPLPAPAQKTAGANEARTARALDRARAQGHMAVYAFLYGMPKGGDLHNHLSGAVYAESWIREAAEDHLCVDVLEHAFVKPIETPSGPQPVHCEPTPGVVVQNGRYPAASLSQNQPLYDALIDTFSMRTFVPRTGESGHDHFFDSFAKFGGISHIHMPEDLDEVAGRAAMQNEQYLELMHTPPFQPAVKLANSVGFTTDYAQDRQKMLAGGLRDLLPAIQAEMDTFQAAQHALEHCGTAAAVPACQVSIRFIYQILRNFPPPAVFAQILLGFEAAAADPHHFVAINLVQPEDDFFAMRDYRLHMQMIAALKPFYPGVHVTLHAGELAPGLVPPEGLLFHIRDAVETAGAERIGHGVDVMGETHPYQLLKEMAARHTLVEINLTSNEGILSVTGANGPLPFYLAAGVPVALSTDDEGVSRSNMTHEYSRAVMNYSLSYGQLKTMARNSLTFSFLPGESLWPVSASAAMYRQPVKACQGAPAAGAAHPGPSCAALLAASEKAAAQWEMERRFTVFEAAP